MSVPSLRVPGPAAMMLRRMALHCTAMVALLACAAGGSGAMAQPAPKTIELHDDAGHTVRLGQPARRVVALSPHLTELVYAAGGQAHLVAVGRFSNHPAAARTLPVVGDAFTLNLEAMARLQPDLILVWQSGMPPRLRERLATLAVPVFESEIATVPDIARTLRLLGQAMGTRNVAEAAAARLLDDWHGLEARYGSRAPVRVFVQLWDQPLLTVNRRHLLDSALRACGGRNAFADLPQLTPAVSRDAVVQADPELIVGGAVNVDTMRRGWAHLLRISAVRNGQIVGIDGDLLTRMGPRFVDGARALCEAIDRARAQRASP